MTRKQQKTREKWFANKLIELLGYNWTIELPKNENEYPDLICKDNNLEFGLEITEFYPDSNKKGGSEIKKREEYNRKLLNELANKYYNKSNIPIQIQITTGHIDESNLDHICGLLITNIPGKELVKERVEERVNKTSITFHIQKLPNISKCKRYKNWTYCPDSVGFLKKIDTHTIERKVKEKAEKITKYSKNLEDIRLLIVNDTTKKSGMLRLPDNIRCNTYGFKQVYWLSYPDNAYIMNNKKANHK